jgi:hypothetical protein
MKKTLIAILLALALAVIPATGVLAATSDTVTVTAVPSYISIEEIGHTTWTINGISGNGVINTSTTYYANPGGDTTAPSATVAAGECYFEIDNTSTVAIDITVDFDNFSGGTSPMTNSNTGSAGATSFGAYSWYEGLTYTSKVIAKDSGSDVLKDEHPADTDLKWGVEISTQTDAWSEGTTQTSTITISAVAD